jgi:hypothetical protein
MQKKEKGRLAAVRIALSLEVDSHEPELGFLVAAAASSPPLNPPPIVSP